MPDAPGESAFEDTHRKPRRAKKLQAVLRRERRTRHVWQDHAGCTTCLRSLRNKSRARAKKSLSHLARQGALHYRRQRCRRPQSSRRHPQKKDGMLPVLEGSVRGIPDRWPCSEPLGQERGPGHSGRVLCPQRGSCHGPGRGSRPCEKGGRATPWQPFRVCSWAPWPVCPWQAASRRGSSSAVFLSWCSLAPFPCWPEPSCSPEPPFSAHQGLVPFPCFQALPAAPCLPLSW